MKKTSSFVKVWDIISPIFIYFIITSLALIALDFLLLAIPLDIDTMLFRQLITSIVAGVFLWSAYRQDLMPVSGSLNGKSVLAVVMIGGCFAIAWNNILGLTGIENYSENYSQVTETFYTGRLVLEIVALCIVIPIVEELLYRGIVYTRIRNWLGIIAAIILSAVIFGLVHMNLVQFVYAAVFGLLLAYITEKTGNLYGAAIAHMVANFTSVLRAETTLLAFMDGNMILMLVTTVVLLIITAGSLWWLKKNR